MAEAAPSRDALVEFVSTSGWRSPLRATHGVVLVDSLTAWSVAPWLIARRLIGDRLTGRRRQPVAAILHQPPGGVGQGSVRTALQRPMDKALYRQCELLIVASTALGHELADVHGLPAERFCVVEPGSDVHVERSTRSSATRDDLRRGRRIAVLSVGNWLPNKGVLELLEAFARLPADHATLHLAGRADLDPGYAARVQARLLAADLSSRVVVHGVVTREEVGRLYAGADVFALLSYAETYGTVFGEALAAGVPTVGWRSGNLPNLIEDGREGCLITPGDSVTLSATLERLSTDDEWRERLRCAAARRGAALPTWDDAADAFFGALSRLAGARD
jgi:glycosyltransferase involved in cell wall biosynthesis